MYDGMNQSYLTAVGPSLEGTVEKLTVLVYQNVANYIKVRRDHCNKLRIIGFLINCLGKCLTFGLRM